jgi:hypothetical protein
VHNGATEDSGSTLGKQRLHVHQVDLRPRAQLVEIGYEVLYRAHRAQFDRLQPENLHRNSTRHHCRSPTMLLERFRHTLICIKPAPVIHYTMHSVSTFVRCRSMRSRVRTTFRPLSSAVAQHALAARRAQDGANWAACLAAAAIDPRIIGRLR